MVQIPLHRTNRVFISSAFRLERNVAAAPRGVTRYAAPLDRDLPDVWRAFDHFPPSFCAARHEIVSSLLLAHPDIDVNQCDKVTTSRRCNGAATSLSLSDSTRDIQSTASRRFCSL